MDWFVLGLLTAFAFKHFICDFPLQSFPYMYENKGTYGHFGGLLHAGIHFFGTLIVLIGFPAILVLGCSIIDFFAHYHIDWAKTNLCKYFNLKPDNSQWFWILLGIDQLLHGLTYLGLVALILSW